MSNIKLTSKILNDRYTQYIYESFDIQNREETSVDIPFNLNNLDSFDWSIGVILGNSGSGKTTILKSLGEVKTVNFHLDKPLISNFDWLEPKDATFLLTSMGLSSVPTWLRPFRLLSNGEQYRAMLAYIVSSANDGDIILIDEYTSVVDRDVAKAMSFALQKYIRKNNKRIILASCHYDIVDWIMPDWICSPQKEGALERCDYHRQGRPKIELQVSRVESEAWNFFKKHHYLTENVNKSCSFFLFEWDIKPVAIVVVSPLPSGTVQNSYRLSRTVVLPDYQGMGIGSKVSEFVCSIIKGRVYTKTINPALGEYRSSSPKWKPTSKNGKVLRGCKKELGENMWTTKVRPSYCYEYIGEYTEGYDHLLSPVSDLRKQKVLTLF
jgi:ABC-type ATPase involved in cell division